MSPMYLRDGVVAEPLINSWYAWPLLVAPATLSMITARLHVRILESYLRAPQVHAAAARHGTLRGGMYLDRDDAVSQVRALLQSTKTQMAANLQLAAAIGDLDALLRKTNGTSLEPLYRELPHPLQGYVELTYDLASRPSFRFIEPLMYRSPYCNPQLQSMSLSVSCTDARPFVLSTPRFASDDNLVVNAPFACPEWDLLFASRMSPVRRDTVFDFLAANTSGGGLEPQALFTPDVPRPPAVAGQHKGMRVRYFGHATLLIESEGVAVLTDPIVSHTRIGGVERFGFEDLPERIDCVLLTHAHQDHVVFETLLQLRHRIERVIVPAGSSSSLQDPCLRLMLEHAGFNNVQELSEMQSARLSPGCEIVGIPFLGEHGDLAIRSKLGYLVRAGGRAVLCLADSNNLDPQLYAHVRRDVGHVDTIFIGMECEGAPLSWLYGPLYTSTLDRQADQSRRLNASDAAKAAEIVQMFEPRSVYVYAMGAEPWLAFISSIEYTSQSRPLQQAAHLVELCKQRGMESACLFGKQEMLWT